MFNKAKWNKSIRTPHIKCPIANRYRSENSGLLFDLLLDLIKTSSPLLIGPPFIQILLQVYLSTPDNMVQLYCQQMMKALYDKPVITIENKLYNVGHLVIQSICNLFYLHCEWNKGIQKQLVHNECALDLPDNLYELLFRLFHHFIEKIPNMQRSSVIANTILTNSNNKLYNEYLEEITQCLLYLTCHIRCIPKSLFTLLIKLCHKYKKCESMIIHRLLLLWNKSTEVTVIILSFFIEYSQLSFEYISIDDKVIFILILATV